MNGVRSRKTVGGVAHDYVTQNGRVIQESCGATVLQFFYGTDGNPYALRYSQDSGSTWQTFYYILNLQGDVVKLIDASGAICAEYSYDAWGKCLSQTTATSCAVSDLADKNPIRYRGYYYDNETGWYYLQSRYYDPIVKRFINADSYAATGHGFTGYNMFAYCNNNPVRYADESGTILVPRYIGDTMYNLDYIVAREQKKYEMLCETRRPVFSAEDNSDLIGKLGTYSQLKKLTAGTGLEVHHLIEKRFFYLVKGSMGINSDRDMPSVILDKETHRGYTNDWRAQFRYGGFNINSNCANTPGQSLDTIKSFVLSEYGGHSDWLSYIFQMFN